MSECQMIKFTQQQKKDCKGEVVMGVWSPQPTRDSPARKHISATPAWREVTGHLTTILCAPLGHSVAPTQ